MFCCKNEQQYWICMRLHHMIATLLIMTQRRVASMLKVATIEMTTLILMSILDDVMETEPVMRMKWRALGDHQNVMTSLLVHVCKHFILLDITWNRNFVMSRYYMIRKWKVVGFFFLQFHGTSSPPLLRNCFVRHIFFISDGIPARRVWKVSP